MAGRVLVANQQTSELDVFDLETLQKLAVVSGLVDQPHEMTYDSRRGLVYIAHTYRLGGYAEGKPKAHEISVFDPVAGSVVDVIDISPFEAPHDIEYDPVKDRLYTGVERGEGGNGIVVIDPGSRRVTGHIPVDGANTHWLAITPDGGKAYLCHKDEEFLSVLDLVKGRQIARIPSVGGSEEVDASPDGRHVFAGAPMMRLAMNVAEGRLAKARTSENYPVPHLLKIDTGTDQVVGRLDFTEYIAAVRVAPDGRVLASEFRFPEPGATVEGPANGRLHVVDGDTMELITSVELDQLPFTIRVTPDASRAFVANVMTGTVSVVDLTDYTVVASLRNRHSEDGMAGTHGLCIVPTPPT